MTVFLWSYFRASEILSLWNSASFQIARRKNFQKFFQVCCLFWRDKRGVSKTTIALEAVVQGKLMTWWNQLPSETKSRVPAAVRERRPRAPLFISGRVDQTPESRGNRTYCSNLAGKRTDFTFQPSRLAEQFIFLFFTKFWILSPT